MAVPGPRTDDRTRMTYPIAAGQPGGNASQNHGPPGWTAQEKPAQKNDPSTTTKAQQAENAEILAEDKSATQPPYRSMGATNESEIWEDNETSTNYHRS